MSEATKNANRFDDAAFRAALARANMTQRAVAEGSGVNVNTVLALYNGRQVPHVDTLVRIFRAVNPVLREQGQKAINPVDLYLTPDFPKGQTLINN